jgi:hypothetical protein
MGGNVTNLGTSLLCSLEPARNEGFTPVISGGPMKSVVAMFVNFDVRMLLFAKVGAAIFQR